MEANEDQQLVSRLQMVSRICTYVVALVAFITLSGWALGEPVLSNFGTGAISTAISTAICLLLCAFAIHNLSLPSPYLLRRAGQGLVAFVGIVALFVLYTYAAGWENAGQIMGPDYTSMAALTASCLLLVAIGTISSDWANGELRTVAATIGLLLAGLDIVGYAYGIEALQRVLPFAAMAMPTALALTLLFAALLFARADQGWMSFMVRKDRTGTIFRWLFPSIVIIPFLFGYLMVLAINHDLWGPHFSFALLAIATTVALGSLVSFLSRWLTFSDSARHRAEIELRRNTGILQAAMSIAKLGAWTADVPLLPDGKFDISKEAYQIFDIDEKTYDGTFGIIGKIIHPDDLKMMSDYGINAPHQQGDREITFRIVNRKGETRWLSQQTRAIVDSRGRPTQLVGIVRDVTDERIAQGQLIQAQKMEAIGNLTGGMAHDFNNLLGIIIGNLDLLRSQLKEKADDLELVDDALDAALRGSDLTSRLLAFARRQPLQPERINPNDLITGIVKLLSRTLGETIEVTLDLSPDIAAINIDPAQLEASITNLANNARDAMPKGGHIIIATANRHLDGDYASVNRDVVPGDYVVIEVSDTGEGMTQEVMSRVFEPFFSTKEEKGTGLGLSMVFGFMKQSGGHINVYSEPGVGTTFRLYLPHAEGQAATRTVISAAAPIGGTETILVVEDNDAMRRIVVRQLHELGYRVIEAENGATARDILKSEKVDVLFTDVVMPGELDGLDLARVAQDEHPETRVLLTSGFPEAKLNGRGAAIHGLRLLSKPYRREDLARMLREILGG